VEEARHRDVLVYPQRGLLGSSKSRRVSEAFLRNRHGLVCCLRTLKRNVLVHRALPTLGLSVQDLARGWSLDGRALPVCNARLLRDSVS
jgi:hypothetical protein